MSCHFEVHGQGPALVLLHGWGMNNGVWHPLMEALAKRYQVTAIELPGHGESEQYEHEWAEAILKVAPEKAVWLGWSLGAQLAVEAALLAPERVAGLVLVGGTPQFVTSDDWQHAMPTRTFEQFADALIAAPEQTLQRFLSLQVKGAENARETLRELKNAVGQRPAATEQGLKRGLQYLQQNDWRHVLAELPCPSVWVFGAKDTLVPASASEHIDAMVERGLSVVIDGAGHAPFLSHPEDCFRVLNDFMEGCDV